MFLTRLGVFTMEQTGEGEASDSSSNNLCDDFKVNIQKEKLRKTMKMKVKWKQKETQLNKKKVC
jgi:hypothetical protein